MRSQKHYNLRGVKKPYILIICFPYLLDGLGGPDYDKSREKGESRKKRGAIL